MRKLIAVYGTLRYGQPNHHILGNSKFLGITETDPIFTLFTNHSFPYLYCKGNTAVTIEVYEITDFRISDKLDALEGFTGKRGSALNWYDITDIHTPWGIAEIYIRTTPLQLPIISTGDWLNQTKP